MDNFVSGSRKNADTLRENDSFEFIEHDICEPLPDIKSVERIYNMACPASPVDFGPRPLQILNVCSRGVERLADLAQRCEARLFHASTSEVYGDPREHPQKESYWGNVNPIGPRSCYDEGKRFAEALLMSHARAHNTAIRIARIFNSLWPEYAQRRRPHVTELHLPGAQQTQPLTVHGDGRQTRSFCYVDDLVAGIIRLIESDVTDPVNLGNPVEISIVDVAREVIELTDSKSEIAFVERPKDDPSLRRPDITRARTLLGWQPEIERTIGFQRTIDWFRTQSA